MSDVNDSPSLGASRDRLMASIAAAESAVADIQRLAQPGTYRALGELSRVVHTARMTGRAAFEVIEALDGAAEAGHPAYLRLADGGDLTIMLRSGVRPMVDVADRSTIVLNPAIRTELEQDADAGRAGSVLRHLPDRDFDVSITMQASHDGLVWIPEARVLIDSLIGRRWASTLRQLTARITEPRCVFVVADLGDDVVHTPLFRFVGPDSPLELLTPSTAEETTSSFAYREERLAAGWTDLPEPADVLPSSTTPDSTLARALRATSLALCWYWLSSSSPRVQSDRVDVTYLGVRDLKLTLSPPRDVSAQQARAAVRLHAWTTAQADMVRFDAAQRAITFAVKDESDLAAAAEPALRTARSLYEIASRGIVAEALAAKRAAREAAATAAQNAAATAREALGKATERNLALLVAAAVPLFASLQKVLDWQVTAIALGFLSAFLVTACIFVIRVDIRSARGMITALKEDLNQYREALSEEDLQSIHDMQVLEEASTDVERSEHAIKSIYTVAAVLTSVAALTLVAVRP